VSRLLVALQAGEPEVVSMVRGTAAIRSVDVTIAPIQIEPLVVPALRLPPPVDK